MIDSLVIIINDLKTDNHDFDVQYAELVVRDHDLKGSPNCVSN